MGVAGRTISFSSGDDGTGCTTSNNAFVPNFPATSPFVTAVGGIYPNGASSADNFTGDPISSGGFSNFFGQPKYQSAAVAKYISTQKSTLPPQSFWNATGRAFPDISSFSEDVVIYYSGEAVEVAGTSCSSPVVSGLFALINDARLLAGKKSMGFMNIFLYNTLASTPSAFFDITQGNNDGGCGGFNAAPGWDPITGVGAINFPNLLKAALALP